MQTYPFRKESDGSIVEVSFEKMMEKDICGCITLDDGSTAKQIPSENPIGRKAESIRTCDAWVKPLESYTIGFPEQQLEEMVAHRKLTGCTGIEFKRDPETPAFFNVHASSPGQWNKYVKSRGYVNKTGSISSKVHLSEKDIENAKKIVNRSYHG